MTLMAERLCVAVEEALRSAGNGSLRHSFGSATVARGRGRLPYANVITVAYLGSACHAIFSLAQPW